MRIRSLSLENFRNYQKKMFRFSDGVTIIYGPNGAGKTNILESIMLLSIGKSPRVYLEEEMVSIGSQYSRVVGQFDNGDKLEIGIERKTGSKRVQKLYKVNGAKKTGVGFIGTVKSVFFAPEDIRLVAGSPSRRREYIDRLLSIVYPEYRRELLRYNKVLKQRNKVLEQAKGQIFRNIYKAQLSFWDTQLIESGTYIQSKRNEFFTYSRDSLKKISKDLFEGGYYLALDYKKKEITKSKLYQSRDRELLLGVTVVGPHRDDFDFILINRSELNLKGYGSRGQQRTGVLCVKILELKYIERQTNEKPILLLDDIFSELDESYRCALESILNVQQTIITTADMKNVPRTVKNKAEIVKLS